MSAFVTDIAFQEMTLAELFLLAGACYGLYSLLGPLQRKLEALLLRWLGREPIIDVHVVKSKHRNKE